MPPTRLPTNKQLINVYYWLKEIVTWNSWILRETLSQIFSFIRKMSSLFLKVLHNILVGTTFTQLHGFTTLAYSMLTQAHANTMLSFDTDSSFWVCDNLVTGHICNDKVFFQGKLVPSIYIVGVATGLSEPSLMGTVVLKVMDDDGKKHKFMLTHVNYVPNSPIDLLSIQVISIQFTDKDGGFDKHGTGINLCYDDHTLIWDHGKYSKTFKMHDSGLPECLFNSGYSCLEAFTATLAPYYDDCVNWAYTSKVKNKHLAASDNGQIIVHLSNNEISIDVPATVENMSTFFKGLKLWHNDGNGTRDIVTFIGVDFIDNMQLKCQIRLSDKSILLVDPETLNFIENPDIASIPQTSEEYC
jgi:hypothetical protein